MSGLTPSNVNATVPITGAGTVAPSPLAGVPAVPAANAAILTAPGLEASSKGIAEASGFTQPTRTQAATAQTATAASDMTQQTRLQAPTTPSTGAVSTSPTVAAVPVRGKVLVVLSATDHLQLKSGKMVPTGFFLSELMRPVKHLLQEGYALTFANPTGERPAMDPSSDSSIYFGMSGKELEQAKTDLNVLMDAGLSHPRPFNSILEQELDGYDGVFIPGGHAPMVDLPENGDLGRILNYFHMRFKPTASLCHGPAALLSAKDPMSHEWAYKGYEMTCFSNLEENMNELKWMGRVPYKLEDRLKENGAKMHERLPMMSNIVQDRELITGQGPSSAVKLGDAFVVALDATKQRTSM